MKRPGFDLGGKIALVTGGCGFLGAHFCHGLAASGATVVAADVTPPDRTEAKELWGDRLDQSIHYARSDIADAASVRTLVDGAAKRHGSVDVLVNAAALDPKFERGRHDALRDRGFTGLSLSEWQEGLHVNLTGTFLTTQAACRRFERQGSGNIINICSTYGLVGPDQRLYNDGDELVNVKPVTYSVTKAAILGLTRYLAAYYRGRDIRVNALTPGGVQRSHDRKFVRKYSERTPLGRMARPEEIKSALVFLASDASSYMTGANLVVDGGWTAW